MNMGMAFPKQESMWLTRVFLAMVTLLWEDLIEDSGNRSFDGKTFSQGVGPRPRPISPKPLISFIPPFKTKLEIATGQPIPGPSSETDQSSGDSLEHRAVALLKIAKPLYPRKVASYISKSRLLQTIEQQISIISLQAADDGVIQSHLSNFQKHLEEIKRSLATLRTKCLLEGHSLHLIDEVLTSCKIHDPVTGLRRSSENAAIRHADLLALRKHTLKQRNLDLSVEQSYTKRDRINRWLFQNLQNSPENAGLHRSMMVGGVGNEMDEKTWARMVVKYWSIDEAATGQEYEAVNISSNEAAHSDAKSLDDNDGKEEQTLGS
ncbi:hypothetical protein F5882DRAFT_423763 [Hyaloscypha sp. PMI_1271]|nr:hypothetical protein F5882DRAFT_423763 [Hyaloscypha sp. PMI_1271]